MVAHELKKGGGGEPLQHALCAVGVGGLSPADTGATKRAIWTTCISASLGRGRHATIRATAQASARSILQRIPTTN
jgi:hypothetical protein